MADNIYTQKSKLRLEHKDGIHRIPNFNESCPDCQRGLFETKLTVFFAFGKVSKVLDFNRARRFGMMLYGRVLNALLTTIKSSTLS